MQYEMQNEIQYEMQYEMQYISHSRPNSFAVHLRLGFKRQTLDEHKSMAHKRDNKYRPMIYHFVTKLKRLPLKPENSISGGVACGTSVAFQFLKYHVL